MARAKKYDHTPVESIRHADKRANIPTEELRDFVAEEERSPKYVLYPRDPSLDPQLVWTGKDEQDSEDLEISAVPIYVQEKIRPQALIENLRETARAGEPEPELSLFDDYDGLEFDDLIEFYQHKQNWSNRMILGDSLLVMNSLAEKEGLTGAVQTIFFDPPYGIQFRSNWQVTTRDKNVSDGRADQLTRQPEQVKAFRDTWQLGIHSYLAYMRDRLVVARGLLSETGSVFVQIGEDNLHLVRSLLDEVMGPDNFIAVIPFRKKTMPLGTSFMEQMDDFIIWYARDKERAKYRQLYLDQSVEGDWHYQWAEDPAGQVIRLTREQTMNHALVPPGLRLFMLKSLEPSGPMPSGAFTYRFQGVDYPPPKNGYCTTPDGLKRLELAGRLAVDGNRLAYKLYADDFGVTPLTAPWQDTIGPRDKVYAVQTSVEVVARCIIMTSDPGDLVLDPTCGSGTTAFVSEQWGRRWITIDTSRVAIALARTRLMAARYPYYYLADTREGAARLSAQTGIPAASLAYASDVRHGFVYKRSPHVTLGGIANNNEIAEGMDKVACDRVIARTADSVTRYNAPLEDKKKTRVSGPFTVESLSPHRVIESDDHTGSSRETRQDSDFARMIIDNLRRAGVQNTKRDERLVFDSLEAYAGEWIQAIGSYTDKSETTRRVAISIGPEHGTVGSEQVKEAAKEAMRGVGCDLLLILGFAFDAHAPETAAEVRPDADSASGGFALMVAEKQMGRLPVQLVRMNPDLAMGDELLKKTGAGNLFMIFGEPDVEIRHEEGLVVAQVRGVDVYDPTTGQIRSGSTKDIACWFIDTNYNGESFFVRHAYFTGADDPFGRLKKALKAEIDESVWSTLYSTESRPFDIPSSGKIAIKVINHYGDEVMKVYEV